MEFLRKQAKRVSDEFKDAADEVWDSLQGAPNMPDMKNSGATGGKYALTATMPMCMNFPDNSDIIEETFNDNGEGPTGVTGFIDTPLGKYLGATGELARTQSQQALSAMVPPDPTATSSISDLLEVLPEFASLAREGSKRGKK